MCGTNEKHNDKQLRKNKSVGKRDYWIAPNNNTRKGMEAIGVFEL